MDKHADLQRLADDHAKEAERLLAGRLGLITSMIKAGAHATLALYYSSQAQRSQTTAAP